MDSRKQVIIYKEQKITFYLGSNWAYVNDIPFKSIRSAKSYITKLQNRKTRKWDYEGVKTITSIRLTEDEKKRVLTKYNSIQAFIQNALKNL